METVKSLLIKIASIVLGLGLSACSQNNSIHPEQDDLSKVENISNPYDYIGELHNKGLDYTRARLMEYKGLRSLSQAEKTKLIESYVSEFVDEEAKQDQRLKEIPSSSLRSLRSQPADTTLKISQQVTLELENLYQVCASNDYEKIKSYIAEEEKRILISKDIYTSDERNLLLVSLAVGKYSNEYWIQYLPTSEFRISDSGKRIIAADVLGAGAGIRNNAAIIVAGGAIGGVGTAAAIAGRYALKSAVVYSAKEGLIEAIVHWLD